MEPISLKELIQIVVYIMIFNEMEATVYYPRSSSAYHHAGYKHYGFPVKLVKVTNTVAVPVPYPVPVTRKVPYPVTVTKPLPYPVPHPVPVQVTKPVVIQQAVPVPVVKPVVIRQPVFNHGYPALSPHAFHQNDYLNYLKHQAYHPNNLHQLYQNHNPHQNNVNEDGSDENAEGYNELNNQAHNLGGGQFDHGYNVQPPGHGYLVQPQPILPGYGSGELTSTEQDVAENERVNSQEMYTNLPVEPRPLSSAENENGNSSQEEDNTSNGSFQHRTYNP